MKKKIQTVVCCCCDWHFKGSITCTLISLQILNGPVIMIRLKANVTMPDMHISDDALDFGDVKCGECRVVIVQLHNHQHVKCDWNSQPSDKDKKQVRIV